MTAAGSHGPVSISGAFVSGDFFRVLRTTPLRGRFLSPEDDRPAAAPVAVVTEYFWRTHLDGRDDAIGRPVLLGGTSFTVIGVAPPRFHGMQPLDPGQDESKGVQAWIPLALATQWPTSPIARHRLAQSRRTRESRPHDHGCRAAADGLGGTHRRVAPHHARQRRAARPRSRIRAERHPDRDRRDRDRAAGAAAHRARDRLRERGQPAPGPRRGTVARARRSAGARGDPRPARAIAHPRDARARARRRRSVDRAHLPHPRPGAGPGTGLREHRLARVALRGLARARGLPGDRARARMDRAPPHGGRRAQTGLTERRPSPLATAGRADRRPGRTVSRPDGARGTLHQNVAGDGQRGPECPSPADGRHLRSVRAPDDAARGAPVRGHPRDGRRRGRTRDTRCALDRRQRAVRLARRAADRPTALRRSSA